MNAKGAAILAVMAVLAVGGYLVWTVRQPAVYLVQGEVEATRIDVSAMVTARVATAMVGFGDRVEEGDLLVELESPQLVAQLEAAEAGIAVAEANRDLAYSTRPETITSAEAALAKAEADVELAQINYDRATELRERSVVSQANLDQTANMLNAAIQGRASAKANLEQARNGASKEQKAVATAQVKQARASLAQIEANIAELTVTSPISGEVTARMAEVGKLFSAGAPLISIVDVDNAWFTFNLREDLLEGLKVGQELHVQVPALGAEHPSVTAVISAINVEGSYANWRATKATGDFDLRTFSVRAEPAEHIAGLRPGMSALVDWSTTERAPQ